MRLRIGIIILIPNIIVVVSLILSAPTLELGADALLRYFIPPLNIVDAYLAGANWGLVAVPPFLVLICAAAYSTQNADYYIAVERAKLEFLEKRKYDPRPLSANDCSRQARNFVSSLSNEEFREYAGVDARDKQMSYITEVSMVIYFAILNPIFGGIMAGVVTYNML